MSKLTPEAIEHLGRLARLELTPEERQRFATQLSSVVEYVEQLSQVDTKAVRELRGVTGIVNALADDTPREASDPRAVERGALLAGAPAIEDGFYVVRAVLGEEVGAA